MFVFRLMINLLLGLVVLSSCASESEVTQSEVAQKGSLNKFNENYSYDEETGVTKSDSRSQYESRSAYTGNRSFGDQTYKTESYNKKRWGGDSEYKRKAYQGNTDGSQYQYSPHFVQQQARAQGQDAAAAGKKFSSRGEYATSASRLNGTERIQRKASAQVESRGAVNQGLKVIGYEDYGNLNVQETNTLLGR